MITLNKKLQRLMMVGMLFATVLLGIPASANAAVNNPTLTIVSTTTGVDTTFNYSGSIPATSVTTVNGSGTSAVIPLVANTPYTFSQTNALLPFPTVSCTGASATIILTTVSVTPTGTEDIVCTFAYADPNPTTTTTTTTAPSTTVLGTSVSQDPTTPVAVQGVSVSSLPVTGYSSEYLALVAGTLIGSGLIFALVARRRKAAAQKIA